MALNIRRALPYRSWDKLSSLPPSRLMALLFVIVVPGGLVLPICYALYAAAVRQLPRRYLSSIAPDR